VQNLKYAGSAFVVLVDKSFPPFALELEVPKKPKVKPPLLRPALPLARQISSFLRIYHVASHESIMAGA
jgi:hypothetical protein